jgi:hypothetical protein
MKVFWRRSIGAVGLSGCFLFVFLTYGCLYSFVDLEVASSPSSATVGCFLWGLIFLPSAFAWFVFLALLRAESAKSEILPTVDEH